LTSIGLPAGHDYMSFASATLDDVPLVVCRTGYTGERGYELVVPAAGVATVWDALFVAGGPYGIRPCGLGARDTLRTEMGYPLHGQDISLDVTPIEGRLSWAVGWDKPRFWGRPVLQAQRADPPGRVLRGLVAGGRGIPRSHMQVSDGDGAPVGEITSGTFSPTRRLGVALALLDRSVDDGAQVFVDVRSRREAFTVSKPPFVPSHVRD
jgi:aminomethyltransferase